MDAFSVSLANGLSEPRMRRRKMFLIAGVFAAFQAAMPLIGWLCVHTVVNYFTQFEKCVPYAALILLLFIGGKMLIDGVKGKEEGKNTGVGFGALMIQGVATSIDALSVGFTIADYKFAAAFTEAVIIAAVTFIICIIGLILGKKFGTRFSGKAEIFGGLILIAIGLEIFIKSFLK